MLDADGRPDPWLSPWFSAEITRDLLPWVYEKGDKNSLVKTFYGEQPRTEKHLHAGGLGGTNSTEDVLRGTGQGQRSRR